MAVAAVLSAGRAWAGACTEGDDGYYVEVIEGLARGKELRDGDDPFYCLDLFVGLTNRWAGPRAAKKIAALRRSPLNPRIQRACTKLLRGRRYWLAKACVRLLAGRGIRSVGAVSTFDLQEKYFPHGGFEPSHLAALGDRRAVAQLIARYRAERICREIRSEAGKRTKHCKDFTKGRRNRWVRKAHREAKIAVLNALWHLADPSSRAFLQQVMAETTDRLIKMRAAKVLARIDAQAGATR